MCVYLSTCNKKSAQSTNYISAVIKGSDKMTHTHAHRKRERGGDTPTVALVAEYFEPV